MVEDIKVPNIGDFQGVEVIEIQVHKGDKVNQEDPLITLETEKATMDIPSPMAGTIEAVLIHTGDKVSEGDIIIKIASEAHAPEPVQNEPLKQDMPQAEVPPQSTPAQDALPEKEVAISTETVTVCLPETDDFKDVTVIEILVQPGDDISLEQSLIALESEKASLELPSQYAGKVESVLVKVGDKAGPGTPIATMQVVQKVGTVGTVRTEASTSQSHEAPKEQAHSSPTTPVASETKPSNVPAALGNGITYSSSVHAGPATRKFARSLGVDLEKVSGSGKRGRITTYDVQQFVKGVMQNQQDRPTGSGIPAIPEQDFSQFGEIDIQPLNRIKKLTARNMSRNWLNCPHVTQFDEADISDLEQFRKDNKKSALENGIRLTPLAFIVKAVISALKAFPQFNASLTSEGEQIVYKRYYHVGIAVDTPNGLLVPVIKDADKKGLFEIAKEIGELSEKAKKGILKATEMQGNTFTISSLGNMGGTQFTPIINAPDVAILGVSRLQTKPVWQEDRFVPKQMLPLALSYDHRVIDGVEGAKFMAHLCAKLQDIRKLLL